MSKRLQPLTRWAVWSDRITRLVLKAVLVAVVVFSVVPALVVAVLSFSNEKFLAFPPHHWGLEQYRSLAGNHKWISALGTSFRLAIPVSLIALVIAVPAVFAASNPRFRLGRALELASLAPLLIPITAYAVATYVMFLELGLLGSFGGLVIVQAAGAVPMTILIGAAAYHRIPGELEFAAMTLGASRVRAIVGVAGRLLLPAFAAGSIFAFLQSFDDAVFVSFLGGPDTETLSREIFLSLREAVDPVITAISTLLMVFTALLVGVLGWLRRKDATT